MADTNTLHRFTYGWILLNSICFHNNVVIITYYQLYIRREYIYGWSTNYFCLSFFYLFSLVGFKLRCRATAFFSDRQKWSHLACILLHNIKEMNLKFDILLVFRSLSLFPSSSIEKWNPTLYIAGVRIGEHGILLWPPHGCNQIICLFNGIFVRAHNNIMIFLLLKSFYNACGGGGSSIVCLGFERANLVFILLCVFFCVYVCVRKCTNIYCIIDLHKFFIKNVRRMLLMKPNSAPSVCLHLPNKIFLHKKRF